MNSMFAKRLIIKRNVRERGAFSFRPAAVTVALFGLTLASVAAAACAARRALVTVTPVYVAPDPPGAVLYTATNCIRALAVGPRGAIWAATEGGVALWTSDAAPRLWTTASGLRSNDIRAVTVAADGACVRTVSPLGEEEIATENGAVTPVPAATDANKIVAKPGAATIVTATTRGKDGGVLTATASGLAWSPRRDAKPQNVALPAASRASHVSALVAQKNGAFVAGLYGDGAYHLTLAPNRAPVWTRLPLSDTCRFVTALALSPSGELVVGTRRDGAFVVSMGKKGVCATPLAGANALPSGDIYGLAAYRGGGANGAAHLFATTFDQGVLEIAERGLVRVHKQATQGRALAAFGDRLYVLRADHTVWAFDGATWTPAWPKGTLRRADVYSVFVDKTRHRLLVGGWGGWAEWDGYEWRQHFRAPELQNEIVTAIASDGNGAVWLGTQRKGLIRCIDGDAYAAFHEAQGLTDDWITALAVSPKGRLLAGTYTGGLLERDGDRFVSRFRADKWAVRALAFRGEAALAATPVGVWEEPDSGRLTEQWRNIAPAATGGAEAQALLATYGGAWVGSRSGLAFVPR